MVHNAIMTRLTEGSSFPEINNQTYSDLFIRGLVDAATRPFRLP